jgi:hypothetical protein
MKFITLVPTTRNDGTALTPSEQAQLLDDLWRPFGGMTNEGLVTGHWIDPASGTHYEDVCVKVAIECDRSRLDEALQAVKRIGKTLGQRAMYFEVTGYDGVQILAIQ